MAHRIWFFEKTKKNNNSGTSRDMTQTFVKVKLMGPETRKWFKNIPYHTRFAVELFLDSFFKNWGPVHHSFGIFL